MTKKKKYSYWELNFGFALMGLLLAPIILVCSYIYQNFIKLEPIDTAYCFCINSDGMNVRAKLDFYERDARESLTLFENGELIRGSFDRIRVGDKVFVLKYSEDSVFANVRWIRQSSNPRGGLIEDDGWVPRICLHDLPPEVKSQ